MSGHVTYVTIAIILLYFGVRNLPFLAGMALLPDPARAASSGIARASSRATAPACSACRI